MILLKNRGIIEIKGEQVVEFLNNILTNNIDKADDKNAIYAALLGPQGKFLFDIFIIKNGENSYLLDANDCDELYSKLRMFKLRMKVDIYNLSNELGVFFNNKPKDEFISFQDPRNKDLGFRIFAPLDTNQNDNFENYQKLRISLNIPSPAEDLIRDKDFALEARLDEMGAIDFHKGCYIGQEMTSRMKRRGTLKQNLQAFKYDGDEIPYDCAIIADEIEIGRVRTNYKNCGMALIRLDRLKTATQNGAKMLADGKQIYIEANKLLEG